MKDCCYWVEFDLLPAGSKEPQHARADFRFWRGSWHLNEYSYGDPPQSVRVQNDW
jgi:hypothetical protein